MKGFQPAELFPDPGVLDRLAGDVAYRKRRAAARIAIELGQDDAGQWQGVAEGLGRVDGVLSKHGVDHKQSFDWLECTVQLSDFFHHRFVDRQAAGRIDEQNVVVMPLRPVDGIACDVHGFVGWSGGEKVDTGLSGDRFQLLDGGGAIHVAGNDQYLFLLRFAQQFGQLANGGGLAGTLQAGHEHDCRRLRRQVEAGMRFTHQCGQFAMHDADQRLTGAQRTDDLLADGFFLDGGDERLDGRQRHVRLEQCQADFAQGVGNVVFGQSRFATQRFHYPGKALSQVIEHLISSLV